MGKKAEVERLWEIDAARGIAVAMMVVSNAVFDLTIFGGQYINIYSGFWMYLARATAALFLVIAGYSLTLSYSRQGGRDFRKYLFRGARIFGWGLAITLATWAAFGSNAIIFGILHLIGISIIVSYPLIGRRAANLVIGIAVIVIGLYLDAMMVGFPWLLWLGLKSGGYSSFDYTPIFPWYGAVLIGIFLGNTFHPEGKRKFHVRDMAGFWIVRLVTKIGRNSLFIYLAHQPVIVGCILLLGAIA